MSSFNAEVFLNQIEMGVFNGHLHEELDKLTHEQLEEVALLMARRLRKRADATSAREGSGA